jgi:hypothetical protein
MGIVIDVICTGEVSKAEALQPSPWGIHCTESSVVSIQILPGRISVGNIYHLTHSRLDTGAGIGEKRSLVRGTCGRQALAREQLSSFSKLQNISRGGLQPLSFTFMVSFLILGSRMLDLGIFNGMQTSTV